jgi:hypothetical protein
MEKCREYVKPIDIEGYAVADKISSIEYITCNKNKEMIIAKLKNGETICTPCIAKDEAELCKKVIGFYRNIVIVLNDDRYYHLAYKGYEEDTRH